MSRQVFSVRSFCVVSLSIIGTFGLTEFPASWCVPSDDASVGLAAAESTPITEKKSRLIPGDTIGAFRVGKVAGATEDGVEPGEVICYRCRYGSSPIVMVFARKVSPELATLVGELDKVVLGNQEHKLRGLVTFFGRELSELKKLANALAVKTGETTIPLVVAQDAQTGPLEYYLPKAAEVNIVVAQDSQVVAVESFGAEPIDAAQVIAHIEKVLHNESQAEVEPKD